MKSTKVIYNTCFADPWVKVAQKLKQEHGYDPVYWIGYEDDDSKKLVPAAFPDAIYHPYFDAWKGIFPKVIAERFSAAYINIDFLKDYAYFELQAIKMMDRMDPDRYSFNFMERQRHFRNLIKYWTACIDHLKPDLVVSGNVPHQLFDYVLYLLCKYKKIKIVAFSASAFVGRIIPLTEISSIGNILDEEYAKMLKPGSELGALKQNLPEEIFSSYDRMKLDYASAEPDYMKKQIIGHKQSSNLLMLTKKFFVDMKTIKLKIVGKDGVLKKGIPTYLKQHGKSIEDSNSRVFAYAILKLQANAYKKRLKKYYSSLVEEPDFNVPYVIVNLHYQPEMTSNPSADIFVDQRLCIEVLAKHIPVDYMIYVKEHPSQFYAHTEGHTNRIAEFYYDLVSYPQVRLMPLSIDPFTLFKNSRAVATLTGTSGWEGMVLGKPVIIFGLSWVEKYSGVLKIIDEKSASMIAEFIDNFRFSERNLLAYLNAFAKESVKAYSYRGTKERMHQEEDECVSNLAESILLMAAK